MSATSCGSRCGEATLAELPHCTLYTLYRDLVFAPPGLPTGVVMPISGGGGAAFRVKSVLLNASSCNLLLLHLDGPLSLHPHGPLKADIKDGSMKGCDVTLVSYTCVYAS